VKNLLKTKIIFSLLFLPFLFGKIFSQEVDITGYLQKIEAGEAQDVVKILPALKKAHPNDPSVIFLDAVLTTNGENAFRKYFKIYSQYPHSNYADAALYRIFSFYFSMGLYQKAKIYLQKLKKEYPHSPYVKYADRNIPEEDLGKVVLRQMVKNKSAKTSYSKQKSIKSKTNRKNKNPRIEYLRIQAGAFLNYDNAKKLNQKFRKMKWDSGIYPKEVGGALLNVVVVGKFKTRKKAEQFLLLLKRKFGIEGRIINSKY